MTELELVQMNNLVPIDTKQYVRLAAAKLKVPQHAVIVAALNMHRDYLVKAGVLSEEDVK
jgi:hypothetical protein